MRSVSIRRLAVFLLAGATVSVSIGCTNGSDSGQSTVFPGLVQAIDRELPDMLERYEIPGAAVSLVRDGEIAWSSEYGYANREEQRSVTRRTVFEAGSIGKSLTAWAIMRLAEQGKLELDDTILHYLPESVVRQCDGGEYELEQVTVRMLLSNSGGFPSAIGMPGPEELRAGNAKPDHLRLAGEPGREFNYSNPGFVLAAVIIEHVSDMPYEAFMEQEILAPMGMHDSGFGAQPRFEGRAARGYSFAGDPVPWNEHGPYGAGGLYATAEDLARFVVAASGRASGDNELPLSGDSIRDMHEPVVAVSGAYHRLMSEHYALGHFVERTANGERLVFHGGESGGWLAAYYALPERGDGLVLLSNSRRSWPLTRLAEEWTEGTGIGDIRMTRSYARLHYALIAVASIGTLAALVLLLIHSMRVAKGRRRFAPFSRTRLLPRLAAATGALVLLVTWWMYAYHVVAMFFPLFVVYPAAALSLFAGALFAGALLVPE